VVNRELEIVELSAVLEVNRIEEFGAFNHGLLISDLSVGSSHCSEFHLQFTFHSGFFNPDALDFLSRFSNCFFLQSFSEVLVVLSNFLFIRGIFHRYSERMLISLLVHTNVF